VSIIEVKELRRQEHDHLHVTAAVLGASPGADRALAKRLMRDNSLGQGHEQTPVCVLRPLGPLPSRS
jgi:hypothetical protein